MEEDNFDFHLKNSSPFISSGVDSVEVDGIWVHAPTNDNEGHPRPNPSGTTQDIGAYESNL